MKERIIRFEEEEKVISTGEIARMKKEAEALLERLQQREGTIYKSLKAETEELCRALDRCCDEMGQTRDSKQRFLSVCEMMKRVESLGESLNLSMTEYYRLSDIFISLTVCMTNGEAALFSQGAGKSLDPESEHSEYALWKTLQQRYETEKSLYDQRVECVDQLLRRTLPLFLERIYTATDMEHNGLYLKYGSFTSLCGEFRQMAIKTFS